MSKKWTPPTQQVCRLRMWQGFETKIAVPKEDVQNVLQVPVQIGEDIDDPSTVCYIRFRRQGTTSLWCLDGFTLSEREAAAREAVKKKRERKAPPSNSSLIIEEDATQQPVNEPSTNDQQER